MRQNFFQTFQKLLDSLLKQNKKFFVLFLLPLVCFIINVIVAFNFPKGGDPLTIGFNIIPGFAIIFFFAYPLLWKALVFQVLRDQDISSVTSSILSWKFFSILNKFSIILVIISSFIAISPLGFLILLGKIF